MRYVTDERQTTFSKVVWAIIVIFSFICAGKTVNDSFIGKQLITKLSQAFYVILGVMVKYM